MNTIQDLSEQADTQLFDLLDTRHHATVSSSSFHRSNKILRSS